jgi:signal transduction histidine kinase
VQTPPSHLSLFEHLTSRLDLPLIRCTKATLVHISHQLEDIVLRHSLPASVFTGFQESSHWRRETARYRQLANVATQICIFAGDTLPPEIDARQVHITLTGDDPLRQEWFLLILGPRFSVLLCGQDTLLPTEREATRTFDTLWTFDPAIINQALALLDEVIGHYRPERQAELRAARVRYPVTETDPPLLAELVQGMTAFEERLNGQLRWQQSLTDTLLASIPHHLYVAEIDDGGALKLIFESPNLERLIEGAADTHQFWADSHVPAEHRTQLAEHRARLRAGQSSSVTYRLFSPDGDRWISDSAHIAAGPDGQTRVYGVIEDITERRRLEAEERERERLRLLLDDERAYSQLKSYFMTTVSHEFRTPLSIIQSSSELLTRYAERLGIDQRRERLANIVAQVQLLSNLLDDISFVMSDRFESHQLRILPLDLNAFVADIITHLRDREPAAPSIVTRIDTPSQLPFDPELLRPIITYLLTNAIRYTPVDGTVRLSAEHHDTRLLLTIEDGGAGLPADELRRLFDDFQQRRSDQHIPGLGLSLGIVQQCVALHRGTITFAPTDEGHTRFMVRLPLDIASN